jgi:Fe/S biogenesis protein NfuA
VLNITEAAQKKILEIRASDDRPDLALRVSIKGRGVGGFQYDLQLVPNASRGGDDVVIELDGIQVLIDPASSPSLDGAKLDYVDSEFESGFDFENPNPLWTDPAAVAVQEVIDSQVNPQIASHGGFVTLLDVRGDTAYVEMGGGCQGCGMANVTLKQGVEVMIRDAVPAIVNIIDSTDHNSGSNPYYKPSKGG